MPTNKPPARTTSPGDPGEPTNRALSVDDLRPALVVFALAMENKLRENDHKNTLKLGRDAYSLSDRIWDELEELQGALDNEARDVVKVLSEAADVANFAMLVADAVGALHG